VIAILQLLRLPNVFTAVADVMAGFVITREGLEPVGWFALLIAASCQLYLAGMVLNDVFDLDVDSRDRPDRPIPSGRVSLSSAKAIGWGLLASGVACGWLATVLAADWRPGFVGSTLAVCIVLYDKVLKRTPLAPFFMGACRALNLLLGMSLSTSAWGSREYLIAAGVGVYVVGVTIFARTEARDSSRPRLALGTIVLLAGIALIVAVPNLIEDPSRFGLVIPFQFWYFFWALAAAMIGWRCVSAVASPSPLQVQAAVRNAVQSIIVLDAGLCFGFVGGQMFGFPGGQFWGIIVLLLLIPTGMLTQWLKST
jgi:4-hydroxybenzoate polyprenyltransferase